MIGALRNTLNKIILNTCSFLLMVLVLTVTWQVFSRYFLNDPSSFTGELSRYAMIWLGLLGASYLFGMKGHLAVTLLLDKLPANLNTGLQFLINCVSFSFVGLAMLKGGIHLMSKTTHQVSPALQLPMAYVYAILPVSGLVICAYLFLNTVSLFKNKNY